MDATLARRWAGAVAAKDWSALSALVADDVEFRGMTPGRVWEAATPDGVVEVVGTWFDEDDEVEGVDLVEVDSFADRESVRYRLRVRNGDGLNLVDQTAYLSGDSQVRWARVMCAGYRRIDG
jgi:hypothetical protein